MSSVSADITMLVARWSRGDEGAFDELMERVYPELRGLAHGQLRRGNRARTVSTTVLVHEAYLRLSGSSGGEWPDRAHFFAFCAKAMRHVLIDFARARGAEKRGGGRIRVTLTEDSEIVEAQALEVLALDEALCRLAERDARMARIVECRFFGGMSVSETADALDTSTRTVEREWARARAYLQHALAGEPS